MAQRTLVDRTQGNYKRERASFCQSQPAASNQLIHNCDSENESHLIDHPAIDTGFLRGSSPFNYRVIKIQGKLQSQGRQ